MSKTSAAYTGTAVGPAVDGDETGGPAMAAQFGNALGNQNPANPLAEFFGEVHITTPPAYDKYQTEVHTLPDAYKGRNLFLRDRVDGLILSDSNKWQCTYGLPWAQTNDLELRWNITTYNQQVIEEEAELGIARKLTSQTSGGKARQIRRGVGIQLEHGFATTPMGKEHYRRQLINLKNSVQLTQNYDVMCAYLECHRHARKQLASSDWRPRRARDLISQQRATWACVQKSATGFDMLHEQFRKTMNQRGCNPDMWVFPPRLRLYLTMGHPERVQYMYAGPDGRKMYKEGPESLANYRGTQVFECEPVDILEDQPSAELLKRERQTGEFYVARDHLTKCPQYPTQYKSFWRNIVIYNEDRDNWHTITLHDMIENANIDSDHFDYRLLRTGDTYELVTVDNGNITARYTIPHFKAILDSNASRELRPFKALNDGDDLDMTKDAFITLCEHDVPVPLTFVLARPFIEHSMCSAILTKGGYETGSTFYGHSDFQLGDDVQHKTHYGTPTTPPHSVDPLHLTPNSVDPLQDILLFTARLLSRTPRTSSLPRTLWRTDTLEEMVSAFSRRQMGTVMESITSLMAVTA